MGASNSCGSLTNLSNNGAIPDLNDDVLWEILRRASLDTLERCRLSSKKIDKHASSRVFLEPFYARSDIFVGYITQFLQRNSYVTEFVPWDYYNMVSVKHDPPLSLSFLPRDVKIKAWSNAGGLIYCRSCNVHGRTRSSYLCKPTTKEWIEIPNHHITGFKTEGYALVVKTTKPALSYSIFRFSKSHTPNTGDYTMVCDIFDSAALSWRRAKDIQFDRLTTLAKKESATYMKGVLHFLTDSRGGIFAFDTRAETWELKPLPAQVVQSVDNRLKLDQNNGKLMLFEIIYQDEEFDSVQYWEMSDYHTRETWAKIHLIRNSRVHAICYYSKDLVGLWMEKHRKAKVHTYVDVKADQANSLVFCQVFRFISDYEPVFTRVDSALTSDLTEASSPPKALGRSLSTRG